MRVRFPLGFMVLLAIGCGSQKFVPVSGTVTLNGKPLPHARVMFQPVGKPRSIEAGEGSSGQTNDKGEFTLKSSTGIDGAMPGTHHVSISATDPQVGSHDTRPPRGGWPLADKVPSRYSGKSELTFAVPAGGTGHADFELTSP